MNNCFFFAILLALIFLRQGTIETVTAQGGGAVTGIQEYFIPGAQAQMLGLFNDILHNIDNTFCVTDASNTCLTTDTPGWEGLIEVRVSIVAYADASVVLIDRASNGYLAPDDYDVSHYDQVFYLDQGEVITLDQLGDDRLIGGDRIVSIGGPIFVVRAGWPTYIGSTLGVLPGGGQVLAGYWELYPTAVWGTEYGSPMGENNVVDHIDDRTTKIVVQAQQDNTSINRDGAPLTRLNRGQSYLIEEIQVGERISSDQPFSASLVASGWQNVDMRFFNLTPPALVDHDYIIPISSMETGSIEDLSLRIDYIRLYIYAYDETNYTIFQGNTPIASGSLDAGDTAVHRVSNTAEYQTNQTLNGSLRVTAGEGARLQVLAAVNSGGSSWDWGFPVVGSKYLIDDYYLAWSPATGPNYPTNDYRGLGHPVFITPVKNNTTIQVDWDNDNMPDETITLNNGRWIALLDDNDNDNTGAHITGSDPFTVVWGQDLLSSAADGYDLGYTILPQSTEFFSETENILELNKDVSPGIRMPGGVFDVTLNLKAGQFEIDNVAVVDQLPTPDFSYHPNSALIHYSDGLKLAVEPAINAQELTWDIKHPSDLTQDYTLAASQTLTVTFQMDVADPYNAAAFPDTQINNAVGFGQWQTFEFRPTAFDFLTITDQPSLIIIKETNPMGQTTFDFTSTVPNHPNFSLTDNGNLDDNRIIFTDLEAGAYIIAEDPTSFPDEFWTLIGVACVDQMDQPAAAEVDLENHQIEVLVETKKQITCTFFNERANYLEEGEEEIEQTLIYLPIIIK